MTSGIGGYPQPPSTPTMSGAGSTDGNGTMDTAREQAAEMSRTVKETGGQVASTVTDQARTVAGETSRQAKDLIHEAHIQLRDQAGAQKEKAAGGLHSLADGLRSMADGNGAEAGLAGDLAKEAADKAKMMATWLEQRDPGSVLNDVRDLARRRPGAFLLGAALAGVAAGRLTRGAMAAGGGGTGTTGAGTTGPGSTAGHGSTDNGHRTPATMLDQPPSPAPVTRPPAESFPRQDQYRGGDTGYTPATGYSTGTPSDLAEGTAHTAGYGIDELSTSDPATTLDGGR